MIKRKYKYKRKFSDGGLGVSISSLGGTESLNTDLNFDNFNLNLPNLSNSSSGNLLSKFSSWNNNATDKFMSSGTGEALSNLGVSSEGLGGVANTLTSGVSSLMNPKGNSTGVGNALQTVGSMASAIPGVGGLIGAGVNLVGGLVNAAFGSNLNEEFIEQTEDLTKQQAGYTSSAKDNASLLSDWSSYTDMAHVSQDDVGSDGWFSNKAKNKTKELNNAIDEANFRAWKSLSNTASNVDRNNDMLAMANYSAYGGPISMNYSGVMSPFGSQYYADGGGLTDSASSNFTNNSIVKGISSALQGLSTATGGEKQELQNSLGRNTGSGAYGIASTAGMGTYDIINSIRNLTKSEREPLSKVIGLYADGGDMGSSSSSLGNYLGIAESAAKLIANGINEANNLVDTEDVEEGVKKYGSANSQFSGSNDDLLNQWGTVKLLNSDISYRDIRDKSAFDDFLTTVPASFEGFNAGSAFGPWGAVIGGIVGGTSSLAGSIVGRRKAKRKAEELSELVEDTNNRILASYDNAVDNNKKAQKFNMERNYFDEGGGIHIKPENRGKFTALKERTGKSATWFKEHGTPAQKKMATFALNARKWKHKDGGSISDSQYYNIMEKVADDNYEAWKYNNSDEALLHALNDPTYNYRGYYNKYPESNANSSTHWTDEFKTVYHPTFSSESIYSGKKSQYNPKGIKGGNWYGDLFIPSWDQIGEKRFDNGGSLFTHGGIFSNGVTEINEGGTHEENPFEGVQVGVDPEGIPNLVEEGEVVYNDYVFSNRMKVPKDVKKEMKIKGDTFADAAKNAQKESAERPNDPISKKGLEDSMSKLMMAQEAERMKKQAKENMKAYREFARGGKLGNLFDGTGDSPNWRSNLWYNNTADLSYLRYAPAAMSGIAAFADIFSKPDYSAADRIASVNIQPALVNADPVGQYLTYKPLDRMFYINQLNKSNAASRRAAQNFSGGNRANALAGVLAADYNYGINLGNLAREAEELNFKRRNEVATFNRDTDKFNSTQSLQAQTANQQSRNLATQLRLNQAEKVAEYRQKAKDAYDTRRSNNLNNFINNLGNIGWEATQANWLNNLAEKGVLLMDTQGNYTGGTETTETTKAKGGKLKRRKRRII